MKKTLIALSSALVIASVTGCGYHLPLPIYAISDADGARYCCEICETFTGERYSVLSRTPDPLNRELRISGTAWHMNVSRTGDVIAINLWPGGPNEMVFVNTVTFKVTHRWPYPSDRTKGILLSDDGKTLAMHYTNIFDDWLHAVTLWDVTSGKPIRKLFLPQPSKERTRIIKEGYYHRSGYGDLAFTPDGQFLALSTDWYASGWKNVKDRPDPDCPRLYPSGCVVVWRTSDGAVVSFLLKGEYQLLRAVVPALSVSTKPAGGDESGQ